MACGASYSSAGEAEPATPCSGRAGAQSPGRHLSASEVKKLIAQFSQSAFQPDTKNALRRDLNKEISDFQSRQSYAIAPTPARCQSIDSAAHQPPFRRRKRRRGVLNVR
jgi:hypothetical protein